MTARLSIALSALLLAGCGGASGDPQKPEDDAAVGGALNDPIMVDPALDNQDQARAGLAGGGAATAEIPPEPRSPEVIAAAIAEATRLAGGEIRSAPAPKIASAPPVAVTAGQLAARVSGRGRCAAQIDYSAVWAARLPDALTVYPRGHVQEAAGADTDGCALRVVHFVTPVSVTDVIDFYHTRLRSVGYSADHRAEGDHAVLRGGKGGATYRLDVRKGADGLTEVDLASDGKPG